MKATGLTAANDRMHAVLTSDVGKKQPGAAVELLHKSPDMGADACISKERGLMGVADRIRELCDGIVF